MATVIITIILIILIALVIYSLIKAKRSGKHPACSGQCNSCGMYESCSGCKPHETKTEK